ncbi:MAG TPA: LamG domain-containing protein [Verrucomicrobiae bacterium]|nr:LamG domain-containing protein [Verrucomicrobiae bacterium]
MSAGRALAACDPPPSGLVGWWPGDGNANDIIGGNNGTLTSVTFAAGEVGEAFSFNGVNSELTVPNNTNQNTGSQISIDAWVNPTTYGHGRSILQKRSASNVGGFTFETTDAPFGPTNGLAFVIWVGGTQITLQTPDDVMTTGAWQHVAATYDGANMRIYINGTQQASMAATGAIDAVTDSLVSGDNVVNPSDAWQGLIDEIQLFSRALSSNEVVAIFNAGTAGECKPVNLDVSFSLTNVVQACKTKTKIDKKTNTTNTTTTCKLSLQLTAANTGVTNSSLFDILIWLGQGSNFDSSAGLPPVTQVVKALKKSKVSKIKFKHTFDASQSGTFIFCTDTNDNVLASARIE